jgi:hypothetical protein
MALGLTQPITEMSTRNHLGGKVRPARRAANLTAFCKPIVWKMWAPRPLTRIALFFLFFYLVCEAIGTAATPGLLCQPRVIGGDDCGEADGM